VETHRTRAAADLTETAPLEDTMQDIVRGKTYRRIDIEGAVTRVDWIGKNGDLTGHTYVPGGTLSSACATTVESLRERIDPRDLA
jgi:hypothetical protein